jgi:hypothetical protein
MHPSNLMRRLGYSTVLAISITAGCASITGSNSQSMTVTAICDSSKVIKGAFCTLVNDKGQWFIETPGSVLVQKSFGDLTINCKYGESMGMAVLKSSGNVNVWGNALAGGIIGAAVDSSTGAGFNYQPMVTVQLTGSCKHLN